MPKTKLHTTTLGTAFVSLLGLVVCAPMMQVLAQPSNLQVQERSLTAQPLAQLAPPILQAQVPTPTIRRRSGRRKPASARGPCSPSKQSLTALIPETNLGLTVTAYPTFFFYMPQTSATIAEFVLLDEENKTQVYQTTVPISGSPAIVSLSLPASKNVRPLEVGKEYHWYFSIICDPEDRSEDVYVDGWVRRVEPNPTLVRRLEKASPGEQVALYQNEDLWYDALKTLAEQRRLHPNHPGLATEWATLLRSVGLDEIARDAGGLGADLQ